MILAFNDLTGWSWLRCHNLWNGHCRTSEIMVREQWTNGGTTDGVVSRKSITNAMRKYLRRAIRFFPIISEICSLT
jgi:hypothetical protein